MFSEQQFSLNYKSEHKYLKHLVIQVASQPKLQILAQIFKTLGIQVASQPKLPILAQIFKTLGIQVASQPMLQILAQMPKYLKCLYIQEESEPKLHI